MTCRSDDIDKKLESENLKKNEIAASNANAQENQDDLENDLLKDDFFKEYIRKKYEEMQSKTLNL